MVGVFEASQDFLGVVESLDEVENCANWEDLADNETHHLCIICKTGCHQIIILKTDDGDQSTWTGRRRLVDSNTAPTFIIRLVSLMTPIIPNESHQMSVAMVTLRESPTAAKTGSPHRGLTRSPPVEGNSLKSLLTRSAEIVKLRSLNLTCCLDTRVMQCHPSGLQGHKSGRSCQGRSSQQWGKVSGIVLQGELELVEALGQILAEITLNISGTRTLL